MNTGFIDKYFINPAIEHGIKSYINLKEKSLIKMFVILLNYQ